MDDEFDVVFIVRVRCASTNNGLLRGPPKIQAGTASFAEPAEVVGAERCCSLEIWSLRRLAKANQRALAKVPRTERTPGP